MFTLSFRTFPSKEYSHLWPSINFRQFRNQFGETILKWSISALLLWLLSINAICAEFTKEQLDKAAKEAGFADADYPYYSTTNRCGPDGWKNNIIPDKSHILFGADWSAACNQHDRDYMTIGMDRGKADKKMKRAMEKILREYLKETVVVSTKRPVTRVIKKMVPVRTTKRVAERVKKRLKDSWKPWKWHTMWISVTKDVVEITYKEVKEEITEIVEDTKVLARASTLAPGQILNMEKQILFFYAGLRTLGDSYFKESQQKQKYYKDWLDSYLLERTGVSP